MGSSTLDADVIVVESGTGEITAAAGVTERSRQPQPV
jgi:hypothetical protein